MIKFNCDFCNKSSEISQSHFNNFSHHFCNRKCYLDYYSKLAEKDKDKIIKDYKNGKSLISIVKEYNITHLRVRRFLKIAKITIRSTGKQRILEKCGRKPIFKINKEDLIEYYINKRMTTESISKIYGCCRETIAKNLRKNNIKIRKLYDYPSTLKNKKNPLTRRRNLIDNPSKRPDVKKKKSIFYKKNPHLQVNNKLRRNKRTCLEKDMISILKKINKIEDRDYVFNKYIKTKKCFRYPDFLFNKEKIIIECDGSYWHQDKKKESLRDAELSSLGFKIYHFDEKQINKKLIPVLNNILCK